MAFLAVFSLGLTPRAPLRVVRHARLPVWPAWQGLVLGVMSQVPGLRGAADLLEDKFGGRVCPMMLDNDECDPFVLLVHHRHAFRPFDFFRPIFSNVIMPEGFPAHPHRGFETMTYVLPGRAGLVHRDSLGCKQTYGDGSVQWMTAGRGMLHEEMWDTASGNTECELYQLWVNLPPHAKMVPPSCQLLTPTGAPHAASVEREGRLSAVRRADIPALVSQGGAVTVRLLAGDADGAAGAAETFSPILLAHVELRGGEGTTHELSVPDGWTCFAYVRRGAVDFGGGEGGASGGGSGGRSSGEIEGEGEGGASAGGHAGTFETAYFGRRGGDALRIRALTAEADVMVFAGEPIGAPVVASGTMVMNSQQQVDQAVRDYQSGGFGMPWDHALDDEQWQRHTVPKEYGGSGTPS